MSSSRVVAGASGAAASVATGAATTGATGATGAAATFLAAFLVSVAAGAATTGATGAGAATGASSVFLATRFLAGAVEVEAEFIIPVPVEEFISNKRTESWKVRELRQFLEKNQSISVSSRTDLLLFFEIGCMNAVIPSGT